MSNRQVRRMTTESLLPTPSDTEDEYEPPPMAALEAGFQELAVSSDPEDNGATLRPSPRKKRHRKKKNKKSGRIMLQQDEAAALPIEVPDEIELAAVVPVGDNDARQINRAIPSPDKPNVFDEAELPNQSAQIPTSSRLSSTGSESSLSDLSWDRLDSRSQTVSSLSLDTSDRQPTPSLASSIHHSDSEGSFADQVFGVSMRLLRVTPDKRLSGPEEPEGARRRWTGRERIRRRAMLVDIPIRAIAPNKKGLSMSLQFIIDGYKHFAFVHSPEHQEVHREFLEDIASGGSRVLLNLEIAKLNTHVESLLEIFDTMCREGDTASANKLLEHVIAILQYASHPSFHLCDRRNRLPYSYVENRPYHIAMLKHIYILMNKARYRSALELAKVLHNLDPTDPLGLIVLMDTLAIKARQYEWMLDLMALWSDRRNSELRYNMLYSRALAFFHTIKTSTDEDLHIQSNMMLQDAILQYPSVVPAILSNMDFIPGRELISHTYYANFAVNTGLSQLIQVYAQMNWPRWQEPPVLDWFFRNAQNMTRRFDNDIGMQVESRHFGNRRMRMYSSLPDAVIRHMCVLRPMADLVLDGLEVPHVDGYAAYDPLPPQEAVDRYRYQQGSYSDDTNSTGWLDWLTEDEALASDIELMLVFSHGYDYIHSDRPPPQPRSGMRWHATRIQKSGARGGDDGASTSGRGGGYKKNIPSHYKSSKRR